MIMKSFPLSAALLLAFIVSCGKDASDEGEKTPGTTKDPVFELASIPENDPATALPSGGSVELDMHWDEPWTADVTEDWLSVSPSGGKAGKFKLKLSSRANTGPDGRSATLTVSSENNSAHLTVKQNGNIYERTFLRSRNVLHSFSWIYYAGSRFSESFLVMPYPESNEYQAVRNSGFGSATKVTSPEGVTYLMDDRTGDFPASGEPFLRQTYTVDFYETRVHFERIADHDVPYDTGSEAYKRYTSGIKDSDGYYMIDPSDSRISRTYGELWQQAGGDRIEYARLCYEWVADNLTYGIYDGPNSIDDILGRMSGDCGNQHAIWLSLMRCAGIPARPVVMNSPNPDGFSHVRGEFYMAGYGWIPVDATYHQGSGEDYFGWFKDENLIVMNRDFGFTVRRNWKVAYVCGLLQGMMVLVWGSGNFDGDERFEFVN